MDIFECKPEKVIFSLRSSEEASGKLLMRSNRSAIEVSCAGGSLQQSHKLAIEVWAMKNI